MLSIKRFQILQNKVVRFWQVYKLKEYKLAISIYPCVNPYSPKCFKEIFRPSSLSCCYEITNFWWVMSESRLVYSTRIIVSVFYETAGVNCLPKSLRLEENVK